MKHNRYDESFKSEAVKLALSGELSYAEVARDLGLNYKTLTNWIYATMNTPKPNKPHDASKPSKQDYQALERQNRAMQKELDIRKKEIEFLKKASAYFASLKP
jgi:transposase